MAAIKMKVSIDGVDELAAKLKKAGIAPSRVLGQAAMSGAEVIREDAARRAPGPNVIAEESDAKFSGTKSRVTVSVGADKAHFYYNFFERGTAAHGPKKKGRKYMKWFENGQAVLARRVRGVTARPWLRPAFDGRQNAAIDATAFVFAMAMREVSG